MQVRKKAEQGILSQKNKTMENVYFGEIFTELSPLESDGDNDFAVVYEQTGKCKNCNEYTYENRCVWCEDSQFCDR